MNLTRRDLMVVGAGGAVALSLGALSSTPAAAKAEDALAAVQKFTGGAKATRAKIALKTPEIAENGNTVPISFKVESPMTADNHVTEVLVLADGNPRPGVATFNFSPMSGEASASTRIRLAKTQDVIAVAKMSDGSFFMDSKTIKVTIGGCGG